MEPKRTKNQKISELMTRLADVGRKLDTAKVPAEMRHWLRERRWVKSALEALGPPR